MTKFYADGSDDFTVYHVTSSFNEEGFYTTDENIAQKALMELITHSKFANKIANNVMINSSSIAITTTEKMTYISLYPDNVSVAIDPESNTECVNIDKLVLPNSLFGKMSDTFTGTFSGINRPQFDIVPCQKTTESSQSLPADTQSSINIYASDGTSTGSFSRATSASATQSESVKTVDEVPILTTFGNYVRVARREYNKFSENLNEAVSTYGEQIKDYVVKDCYAITPEDKAYIVQKYMTDVKSEDKQSEVIYGFAIRQCSPFMINIKTGIVTMIM